VESSEFVNGIVYGSNVNEFQLSFDAALQPQVTFDRYLIRTDQPTDNATIFPFPDRIYRNQNPGFLSPGDRDFRLAESAFARNKGTSSTIEAINDLQGNLRNCDGLGFDLGCFEWCP
jgi:hypothetical protein